MFGRCPFSFSSVFLLLVYFRPIVQIIAHFYDRFVLRITRIEEINQSFEKLSNQQNKYYGSGQ